MRFIVILFAIILVHTDLLGAQLGPLGQEGVDKLWDQLQTRFNQSNTRYPIESHAIRKAGQNLPFTNCVVVDEDNNTRKAPMFFVEYSIQNEPDNGPLQPGTRSRFYHLITEDWLNTDLAAGAQFASDGTLDMDRARFVDTRNPECPDTSHRDAMKSGTSRKFPNEWKTFGTCKNGKPLYEEAHRKSGPYLVSRVKNLGKINLFAYCWK